MCRMRRKGNKSIRNQTNGVVEKNHDYCHSNTNELLDRCGNGCFTSINYTQNLKLTENNMKGSTENEIKDGDTESYYDYTKHCDDLNDLSDYLPISSMKYIQGHSLNRSIIFWKSTLALALLFFSIIVEAATIADRAARLDQINESAATGPGGAHTDKTSNAPSTVSSTSVLSSKNENDELFVSGEETLIGSTSHASAVNNRMNENMNRDDSGTYSKNNGQASFHRLTHQHMNSYINHHEIHQRSKEVERYFDFRRPNSENDSRESPKDDIIIVATIDGSFHGISRSTGSILWKRNGINEDNNHDVKPDQTATQEEPSHQTATHLKGPQDSSVSSSFSGHETHHRMRPSNLYHSHDTGTNINTHSSTATSSKFREEPSYSNGSSHSIERSIFAPLISTSTTSSSGRNNSWKTTAVPSVDGRVFLTPGTENNPSSNGRHTSSSSIPNHHRSRHHQNSISELTSTISTRDLVNAAPFVDIRGRFYVGSRNTVAVAFDRDTGDVLRILNGEDGSLDNFDHNLFRSSSHSAPSSEKARNVESNHLQNVVWAGRVDYSVSIYDARTGELDVQFSTSEVLSIGDMLQQEATISNPSSSSSEYWMFPSSTSAIITTPGGHLAMRDLQSREIEWISNDTLDAPVAFALGSTTGESLTVDIIPDAPNLFSEEYLAKDLDRRSSTWYSSSTGPTGGTATIDKLSSVFDEETVMGTMTSTGQLFALPLGGHSSRVSGTTGRHFKPHELPHYPNRLSQISNAPHDPSQYLPAIYSKKCDQSSPSYLECLAGANHFGMYAGSGIAAGDFPWSLSHKQQQNQQQEQQRGEYSLGADSFEYGEHRNNKKSRLHIFLAVMTSWIPPAIAFAFVLSFEMGRRERAREEKVKMMMKENEEKIGIKRNSGLKETSSKHYQVTSHDAISDDNSHDGIQNDGKQVGVIHLSDQVLGFGGHGTVVYKGKLDGRNVAVKRMLKAYHASAEREISLLIESDGHPNVVRYFLKESRGDFVYLALELCDMTLQDLIVSLSKHKMKEHINYPQQNGIDAATRRTLFNIALGVKHIHSLRIVHRDLKPQNILLAKKAITPSVQQVDGDIYDYFQAEQYIPKISDMGLGKQLTAHSSFGLSTLNQSVGVAAQEGSTIAGAGPGSVGWQAPEVMAQRLSPETSHYGNLIGQQGQDAMVEASPVETSLNGRTSRSVDIFSLGCIFYCTIVPGAHPFGEWFEREANIMKNRPSIVILENMSYDASDLIKSMIDRDPSARPTATQVVYHPFFWSSMKRLAFLCDVSDRIEADNNSSTSLEEPASMNSHPFDSIFIEEDAVKIVGTAWDSKLDPILFNNVSKFRSYDQSSVRDCLRLIRNKHHHFDELPQELKDRLMPSQEGLLEYFEHQFPRLLMHCYNICRNRLVINDPLAIKYDIPIQRLLGITKDITICSPTKRSSDSKDKHLNAHINESTIQDIDASKNKDVGLTENIIIWEGSDSATSLQCRGWMRSDDEWMRCVERKRNKHLTRCIEDPKYRTRLCNWWDKSQGTQCAMRKKNKCIFAHGPVELRVKDGKKKRWSKLVDKNGNNSNPFHSGGEDTYGAARSIESVRKEEGKWKTEAKISKKGKQRKPNIVKD